MSKFIASKSPRSGIQNSEVLSPGTPLCSLPPGPKTGALPPRGGVTLISGASPEGFKISPKFSSVLGPCSGSFWEPTWAQNRSNFEFQRLPRRSCGQVAAGTCFRSCFGLFFGPLGTSKIVLPSRREHDFYKIARSNLPLRKCPKMVPKSAQKTAPRSLQWSKMSIKCSARN